MYDPYAIAIISKMHHEEILREAEAKRMIALYGVSYEGPVSRLLSASGKAIVRAYEWVAGALDRKPACAEANATC